MADTLLDVVNDKNEVIGQEMRSIIHAKGLLHREVHIWFITPQKEIIFQKRSMKKDTNPGLLTVAVGGHVEGGSTYAQSALIEAQEETGLLIYTHELTQLVTYQSDYLFPESGLRNFVMRAVYGYVFKGSIEDLKIEPEDGEGFIAAPIAEIRNISPELLKQMSPRMIEKEFALIADELEKLVA